MKTRLLQLATLLSLIFTYIACQQETPLIGVSNRITITTTQASSITADSASCGGTISDDGGDAIRERGVCWSINQNPTTKESKASSGMGKGSYSVRMTALKPNTKYYFRAYSISEQGDVYGNELSFTTPIKIPVLTTVPATDITGSSAVTGGSIQSDGGGPLAERGICWSTSNTNPSVSDNVSSLGGTNWNATYPITISNLMAYTTYWVRAFARNSAGTAYGNVISFRTGAPSVPTLSSVNISNLTRTTATATASITAIGGAAINRYGVCISTSPSMSPLLNCFWTYSNFTGQFNVPLSGLQAGTTYYIRAYAQNAAGEGLSPAISSFTTLPAALPSVNTVGYGSVTMNSAMLYGEIPDDGGLPIQERGFYFSTGTIPTTSSAKVTLGTNGTGSYSGMATGLNAGTTYYFRAFARNAMGTTLGATTYGFTTIQSVAPTVTTNLVTNITASTAVSGGVITSDGGLPITSRGVVWSTTVNPVISGNGTPIYSGSGSGSYTTTVTGLPADRTIYLRAFAVNSSGNIGYGTPERSILTKMSTPVLASPGNNASVGCCYLYFSWSAVSGANSYELQLSTDPGFSGSVLTMLACGSASRPLNNYVNTHTTNANNACINAPTSASNGVWYWRVRAISATNSSGWSTTSYYNYRW